MKPYDEKFDSPGAIVGGILLVLAMPLIIILLFLWLCWRAIRLFMGEAWG